MSISANGFSPENLERIYVGEPALVGRRERLPSDALTDREFQVAGLAAESLSYEAIALEVGRSIGTIRGQLSLAYKRLGIGTKLGLAGYFPLDRDDPRLQGKTLGQLSPRVLEAIEILSQGKDYRAISEVMYVEQGTVRGYIKHASGVWTGFQGGLAIIRIANGIRANYARKIAENGKSVSGHLGSFALHSLVDYEPRIRELFGFPAAE